MAIPAQKIPEEWDPKNTREGQLRADRITGQILVHHESTGENPVTCGGTFSAFLATREQVYPRRIRELTEEWIPLDYGPLPQRDVGLVLIENRAGKDRRTIPSVQEYNEIQEQLLLVSLRGDSTIDLVVRPGTMQLIGPSENSQILIRSAKGVFSAITTCIPR